MDSIGIIILAAGESTCLGLPKQLLPYKGATLLHHACQQAEQTTCDPIIVVLGAESDRCRAEIADTRAIPVVDPYGKTSFGGSLRAGIIALEKKAPNIQGVLLMTHDQPLITPDSIMKIRQAWNPPKYLVAATDYRRYGGIPALFHLSLFPELKEQDNTMGLRQMIDQHADQTRLVTIPNVELNIDTADDYRLAVDLEAMDWPRSSQSECSPHKFQRATRPGHYAEHQLLSV